MLAVNSRRVTTVAFSCCSHAVQPRYVSPCGSGGTCLLGVRIVQKRRKCPDISTHVQAHAVAAISQDWQSRGKAGKGILPPCLLFVGFHPDEVGNMAGYLEDIHPEWKIASVRPSDFGRRVGDVLDSCAAGRMAALASQSEAVQGLGCMVLCSGEAVEYLYELQALLDGDDSTPTPIFGVLTDDSAQASLLSKVTAIRTEFQRVHALHLPVKLLETNADVDLERVGKLQPVLHATVDAAQVPCALGGERQDASCIAVLDGLIDEGECKEMLLWLIGQPLGRKGAVKEAQLEAQWEQQCVDYPGAPPTWGLQHQYLKRLQHDPPAAVLKLQSRLAALYPEYRICYMPGEGMADEYDEEQQQAPLSAFVANAVMEGQRCAYHHDADPSQAPAACPWVQAHGWYYNREPGKPLFVSCLVYLDEEWPADWHAETLFADSESGVGLMVQPRGGRVVLMDQDVPHRIVAPSAEAERRPRFSLVWKLVFWPKEDYSLVVAGASKPQHMSISRPHWGRPLHIGLPRNKHSD